MRQRERLFVYAVVCGGLVLGLMPGRLQWVRQVDASQGRRRGAKEPDVPPPVPGEDWKRLGHPRPGDWLYAFREEGQTFAESTRSVCNRKSRSCNSIYVLPLGDFAETHGSALKRCVRYFRSFLRLRDRRA